MDMPPPTAAEKRRAFRERATAAKHLYDEANARLHMYVNELAATSDPLVRAEIDTAIVQAERDIASARAEFGDVIERGAILREIGFIAAVSSLRHVEIPYRGEEAPARYNPLLKRLEPGSPVLLRRILNNQLGYEIEGTVHERTLIPHITAALVAVPALAVVVRHNKHDAGEELIDEIVLIGRTASGQLLTPQLRRLPKAN